MSFEHPNRNNESMRDVELDIMSRPPEHNTTNLDLDRMNLMLDILGHPEQSFRVIHITGTNGKGSTARMAEAICRAYGMRTGLFTSPHLEKINERIAIDGQQLSDDDFIDIWDQTKDLVALVDAKMEEQGKPKMSFFEVLTAMAIWKFADTPVDVAIVEVGMGGLWDATNVLNADAAIIGPVDMDHMQWLGDTVEQIATEKAGIIKPNCTAIIGPQPHEEAVMPILAEAAERNHAMLVRGEHQAHNALAALAASEVVIPVNGPLDGDLVAEALSSVKIPGRIEQIRTSPTIILDGGHNVNAAEALRKAIEESYDFKQLVGVVAMMRDKQVEEYLGVLEPILSSVVVTENSWRERVMPADELEKIAVDVFGRDRVIKEANLPDAIQTAVNMVDAEDELGVGYGHGVLICGSFVTAGDARLMLEEHASPTMRQAMAVHQPAVDPDDSDQPADKAEDEAADNLEDSVSPDDFDVFDVLGLGKEQAGDAGDAGDAGTGTASADTDSTDTASADTDDSADAR